MWHEDTMQDPEGFDNPSEYVPYHVGRTHLHGQLDIDEYFTVRVKEDLRAYRRAQVLHTFASVERLSMVPNIMENLYRTFTQHKWLPLQTAWPFNLRMVSFVLMYTDMSNTVAADKLVKRIRSWGCPVSRFSDGYDEWVVGNSRDVMFNKFQDIKTVRPSLANPSLARDLHRIGVMIRDGR